MRHVKTVVVPETTKEVIDFIVCDLCGERAPGGDWAGGEDNLNETIVSWRRGNCYPESSHEVEIRYDICPDCFENRLMVWLAEQDATPTEKEDFN